MDECDIVWCFFCLHQHRGSSEALNDTRRRIDEETRRVRRETRSSLKFRLQYRLKEEFDFIIKNNPEEIDPAMVKLMRDALIRAIGRR